MASISCGLAFGRLVFALQASRLDLAEVPALRRLMSESYFGGYDMHRFDVIGAYDRRAEFFASISSAISGTLNADRRENVTPISEERGNVMNDARLIARTSVRARPFGTLPARSCPW